MDLRKERPAYEDIIDYRDDKPVKGKKPTLKVTPIVIDTSDKELAEEEPTGNIGEEMQPLRGSGRAMQKRINRWKVR